MGWLRLVGSIKLQFSFAEYGLFYRVLVSKRPIIWSILLIEATPDLKTDWANTHTQYFSLCLSLSLAFSLSLPLSLSLALTLPPSFSCNQPPLDRAMGWLRSVGSIKLYVSFAEYRLFYRSLLQKRAMVSRIDIITGQHAHTLSCVVSLSPSLPRSPPPPPSRSSLLSLPHSLTSPPAPPLSLYLYRYFYLSRSISSSVSVSFSLSQSLAHTHKHAQTQTHTRAPQATDAYGGAPPACMYMFIYTYIYIEIYVYIHNI